MSKQKKSKYEEMFPGKQMHFGDNDATMKPKAIWIGDVHLCEAICGDAKKCAVAQAFEDGDYVFDEIRVGWLHTFLSKGDHVYAYRTPRYKDPVSGKMKSIAREFDEAGGEAAKASGKVRPARVPAGSYELIPLVRRKRTAKEIENQREIDKDRAARRAISRGNRTGNASSIEKYRRLAIH